MSDDRDRASAVGLADGRVLLAGGFGIEGSADLPCRPMAGRSPPL
jgi:hypothetical protein